MKNSSDIIGNRTHDLATCSAVPQPTAPPRSPTEMSTRVFRGGGGTGGRCVWPTNLPPSCADYFEIWELQPPGTIRASTWFNFSSRLAHPLRTTAVVRWYETNLNVGGSVMLGNITRN
jgi:hypothetical protein